MGDLFCTYDELQKSYDDTIELIKLRPLIISIDTSLVHLASWFGLPIVLILNAFPDGRWLTSSRKGLRVINQQKFNNWEQPCLELFDLIIKEDFRAIF